ncbi:malate dehydrogenase, mitochondrial-like [Osmia bicornis bicornis]|uniref:malate dehydrogenase, mitochondrial-like n=1 Tax=Osmia bicornis bicornis TaxID=1437191 RepID=UPI001EAED423|nr:malate dehydrogenase, mitochondrial-like [Osmia bicornis bicornis]
MFASTIRRSKSLMSRTLCGRFFHSLVRYNISDIHFTQLNRFFSKSMKVAVLGAASKTGNCLSLFLKQSPLIDELVIYDSKSTHGLSLDLSNIDTKCKVNACDSSEESLRETLVGTKIVMIVTDQTTGDEIKSNETLMHNANILSNLLPNVIKFCPQAMVAVAMNPINSLIPLTMEIYKKAGIYNPHRIFGVISLNCVRANTFAAEVIGIEPECVMVPVIGGACSNTCVPLFSQAQPCNKISEQEARKLTEGIRTTDGKISRMSKDKERTCFALAFGAARFCLSLCKALRHQSGVVECAYVRSCLIPELTYFAAPLELGPDGIQRHLGIPPLNDYECNLLKTAMPFIKNAITLGEALALGDENNFSEARLQGSSSGHEVTSPPVSQSSA